MQLLGLAAMTTLPLDLVARCIGDSDIVSAIPGGDRSSRA
jgi:hypothetical protein